MREQQQVGRSPDESDTCNPTEHSGQWCKPDGFQSPS
jgi:hypothetical protein